MNKNINSFGSNMNLVSQIIDSEVVTYGSAPNSTSSVGFAYHEGSSAATGTQGQIVFNALNSSNGIILVGDKIVSARIQKVEAVQKEGTSTGVKTVTVTYVADDLTVKTGNFEVVDEVAVKGWISDHTDAVNSSVNAKFAEIDGSLGRINSSVNALETYVSATNIASSKKDIVVTATDGTTGKSYDVSVNIDGATIVRNADTGVLSAGKTLAIRNAKDTETTGHKFITISNAAGTEESSIDIADLVGHAVADASYDPSTNDLTIVWATESGDQSTVISMSDLLDIDDIKIATGSGDYLSYTIDGSTGVWGVKIQDVSTADANHMGLADAKQVKDYVDFKSTDLAVTAEGDTYISAVVDTEEDNKHVIVSANIADVTVSAGTRGTWTVTDGGVATLADEVAPSISGEEGKLLNSIDAIGAVKTYVDAKVAVEAAERAAKIEAAVKALDAEVTSTDGTNIQVKVTEVDGKVTGVSVATEKYATITKTATTSTATTPATDAALVVTTGDEGKLVKASDLANVAAYAADKVTEEMHRVDKKIAELDSSVTSDDDATVKVNVVEENGVLTDVVVTTLSAGVNRTGDAAGARVLAATTATGAVTGADIAKIKGYVDDVVADFQGAADSSVTVSDASNFITTKINFVDGALTSTESSLSYVHAEYNAADNTISTPGLADGQFVLDLVNDRINDLDLAADAADASVADASANVKVTISETNGVVKMEELSVQYTLCSSTAATKDQTSGNITAMPTFAASNPTQIATGTDVKVAADYAKSYTDSMLTWSVI